MAFFFWWGQVGCLGELRGAAPSHANVVRLAEYYDQNDIYDRIPAKLYHNWHSNKHWISKGTTTRGSKSWMTYSTAHCLTKGTLWSFLVNKQKFCLHSVILTTTHCVNLWRPNETTPSVSFLIKHLQSYFFSNKVMKFETCVFASMSASLQCEKVCPEHVHETNI